MEDIVSKEWWGHLRFSRVGHALEDYYNKNPNKKKESVDHFVEHGGTLSYKDFFHHIDEDLKCNL